MSKILVVDDDKDFRFITQLVLEKENYEVISAADPEEGIEKVQNENPDLIILDVMMPDNFEGFDVARKIREDLGLKDLPIILLTGMMGAKEVPYSSSTHENEPPPDHFFEKPVEPGVLTAKVKEMLKA